MTGARIVVPVASQTDVERARREARRYAETLGFGSVDAERVTLITSELATNLFRYARDGQFLLEAVEGTNGLRVRAESRDRGPGIPDIAAAMQDGFSTGGGLGSGLAAVRRLANEFSLESDSSGTRIVAWLWPTARS